MTETQKTQAVRTHWQLWVVGIIATLWGAMGAMDYVMTQTRNEAYLSKFTPEQLELFTSFLTEINKIFAVSLANVCKYPNLRLDNLLEFAHFIRL